MDNQQLLPVGAVLQGRYRVDRQLSSGGFGNTYVVTNIRFDEKWVMKEFFMKGISERDGNTTTVRVSDTAKSQFEAQRQKFNKEARRLRRLHHSGIVHVEDLFDENGTSYYVMDYIDGGSLAEAVKRHGPFAEQRVRELLPHLLNALDHVHQQHIWHLDLKPGNIMLRNDGTPVLIDFGSSKQMGQAGGQSTSTAMSYTQGYAPSEQVDQNFDRIGPWTDLYALGATLYNLLTAHTPPMVSDIQEAEAEAFHFTPGVSDQMQQLILWLMNPNRRKRPQSVSEVRTFLNMPVPPPLGQTVPAANNGENSTQLAGTPTEMVASTPTEEVSAAPKLVLPPPPPAPDSPIGKRPKKRIALYARVGLLVAAIMGGGLLLQHLTAEKDSTDTPSAIVETYTPPAAVETFTVNGVSFNMVRVEGGTFTMGATTEQGSDAIDREKPSHRVTLSTYSIGETEVTQQLWEAVMGSNPSYFNGPQRPVELVSWDYCQDFIRELNRLTGRQFRLPTEAEWEYAARGGSKSTGCKYSGSHSVAKVAWYTGNSGSTTHNVKTKQANELGLYDMSGNVWEWCQDWYGDYSSSAVTNPTGPSSGSRRVHRGGSWSSDAGYCRVSIRGYGEPSYRNGNLGLRLAL